MDDRCTYRGGAGWLVGVVVVLVYEGTSLGWWVAMCVCVPRCRHDNTYDHRPLTILSSPHSRRRRCLSASSGVEEIEALKAEALDTPPNMWPV